jgi:hypothetical protein
MSLYGNQGSMDAQAKSQFQQIQLGMLTTEGKLLDVDGKLKRLLTGVLHKISVFQSFHGLI